MITIKDFSATTGLSIRMLRYMEDLKLLVPERGDNNYRLYKSAQIIEAKNIKALQELGIQLNEIKKMRASEWSKQLALLELVLAREKEISEIKSETIPQLRSLINSVQENQIDIFTALEKGSGEDRKFRTLAGDEKFQRTAYNIPILKTIYEDHLEVGAKIICLETDFMKFGYWLEESTFIPRVYSIFNESAFSFGNNLTEEFITNYKNIWNKFLPGGDMSLLEEFSREDIRHLMGHHDIVIRTKFEYKESGEVGEIIMPYTPIYTMTRLSGL